MSIAEFPRERLCCAEWWLPVAVIRTSVANTVRGGVSQCVLQLLKHTLLAPLRMSDIGTTVDLQGPTLLRLRVAHIIADEAALKSVWNTKGSSCTKPCVLCANVVSKHSGLGGSHAALVDITCSDARRFQPTVDADIWRAFDTLAVDQHRLPRESFAIAERAAGIVGQHVSFHRLPQSNAIACRTPTSCMLLFTALCHARNG